MIEVKGLLWDYHNKKAMNTMNKYKTRQTNTNQSHTQTYHAHKKYNKRQKTQTITHTHTKTIPSNQDPSDLTVGQISANARCTKKALITFIVLARALGSLQ